MADALSPPYFGAARQRRRCQANIYEFSRAFSRDERRGREFINISDKAKSRDIYRTRLMSRATDVTVKLRRCHAMLRRDNPQMSVLPMLRLRASIAI